MSPAVRCIARGFSLIEMLVAMVILSLSLGVLYQAAMGATRNVRVAAEYSEALMLAESVMSEIALAASPDSEAAGSFGVYDWRARVLPLIFEEDPAQLTGAPLAEVVVTVSWGEGERRREVTLNTFSVLLAPAS